MQHFRFDLKRHFAVFVVDYIVSGLSRVLYIMISFKFFAGVSLLDLLRNDLFVTLVKAEIDKAPKSTSKGVEYLMKSAPKNIELRIMVLDSKGVELQVIYLTYSFLLFYWSVLLTYLVSSPLYYSAKHFIGCE
jgi:hypothetical protein